MAEAVAQLIKQGLNLQNRGRVSDAEQVYQRVLAAEPDHAAALHLLGTVALYQQDFDAAINRINQAIARSPKQAMFHHNLGAALRAVGRFDEAQEHYWQALHLQPDYAEAFFNLSAILRGTEPHAPLDALEDLLAKPGTGPEERCFLHFAAGKWYDDRSEYDRAFFHYREGNALRESTFAPDAFEHYVDELIAVFDWAFIERRQHDGFAHDLPVFVIGMPRSGTTLLEQVLAAHPQVLGAGELPSINSIVQHLPNYVREREQTYPACVDSLSTSMLWGFGKAVVEHLQRLDHSAARVVDKFPTNFLHAGLIAIMLPGARIIHCRRNPLDTCLSCYFQRFTSDRQTFANNLFHLGRYYRAYERLMAHWRSVLPRQIFEVDYEAMVTNHEATCRKLIDFAGLSWNDACLRAHKTQRTVLTASQLQVRQPVYHSSIERWRHYEKHLGPLRATLKM